MQLTCMTKTTFITRGPTPNFTTSFVPKYHPTRHLNKVFLTFNRCQKSSKILLLYLSLLFHHKYDSKSYKVYSIFTTNSLLTKIHRYSSHLYYRTSHQLI